MKKLGIGVGVFLLLLVGSALVVPGFVNWNEYKTQIELTASNLSDREVVIKGDLSLSILPSPSFSAEDVSVSNIKGGQATNFITLKSVDVNVAFFPLLRGQIQVKKFILIEPVVALEISEDGRENWQFGNDDKINEDENTATELSFEQFQIENGQISYHDFKGGSQELIRTINAAVTIDSLRGPFEVKGSARYKNLPIRTELMLGTIRKNRKVPVNIIVGLIDDDVRFKFSGSIMPDADQPQLDGKINLDANDIGDLFLSLSLLDLENTNHNKKSYNQSLSLETNVAYNNDQITLKQIEFEMGESRGSGELSVSLADRLNFSGNIAVNSFNLDSILPHLNQDVEGDANDDLNLTILNEIDGSFNFKLGALRFNDKIASQLDLSLNVDDGALNIRRAKINMPGGSELFADGIIKQVDEKPEFNGNIVVNSGNLRAFLNWLKIDTSTVPVGRLTRLTYKGGIKADPELVQFYEISGGVDTFKFKGGLSYALQQRPAFGLDMIIENLNIDNYWIENTDEPINMQKQLALLGDFDANYKFDLRNITRQGIKIKNINVVGNLIAGNLDISTLKINGYAGFNLTGNVIAKDLSGDPEFDISMNVTAISLLPLQRAYRFKTDFDISKIGAVALNATIKGDFEKLNLDVTSTVGSNKLDIKGDIRSATLKQLPEIGSVDLIISASNPSLSSIINQFDLPLIRPGAVDDRMISIVTSLKGNQQLIDVDGVLNVAGGALSLKGRTNLEEEQIKSFDFAADISADHMREFIRGLGIDFNPSKKQLGMLQVKMALSGNAQNVVFNNIAGQFGPTKLTGSGEIKGLSVNDDVVLKPNFDFTLTLDDIPAHDFMQTSTAGKDDWGKWSKEPMDLTILNKYDGRALITANSIKYNEYNFENPRFEAVLKDGVININGFTGKLFGGDVTIASSFNVDGELAGNISLKNASAVLATNSVAGIKPVSGTFDMDKTFSAKGNNQDALISSLSGSGNLRASAGIISGIDIAELSERLKVIDDKNGLLGLLTSSLSGGQTPYQGGVSQITTKDGKIQFSPFDVKMQGADSTINMVVDLGAWNMNLDGNMALSDHPDAPPIGVSILGALDDPAINYNTKKLETYIGAKIASNLLQNMVDGDGGLGRLFGINPPPQTAPLGQEIEQDPTVSAEEDEPETQPETVEELGLKLLDRLFQKPPEN